MPGSPDDSSDKSSPSRDFFAVIPAGGSGTRLWPLSRAGEPKFLLDLFGTGSSLLQDTVKRLEPFAEFSRLFVVTGHAHEAAVREQLGDLPSKNLLVEPSSKNSAAAVGFAAFVLAETNPDAIVGFFAADHVVTDDKAFGAVLETAINAAQSDMLVTIGITPTEPSSAFGYIKRGPSAEQSDGAHHVSEFVEKPSFKDAEKYVESGEYLWNAGIFVGRVRTVTDAFERFAPALAAGLTEVARLFLAGEDFQEQWEKLEAEAFDYVVAEPAAKAGLFLVVPGDFGWRDVGDFASLAQAKASGQASDVVVVGDKAKVHPHDSTGIVVGSSGRVITVLGVKDIVIVDTPDALLVTTKEHVQDVKKVVNDMKLNGLEDLL